MDSPPCPSFRSQRPWSRYIVRLQLRDLIAPDLDESANLLVETASSVDALPGGEPVLPGNDFGSGRVRVRRINRPRRHTSDEILGISVLANGLGSDAFLAVRLRKSLHRITARKFGILNEPGFAPYESG